MRKPTLPAFAAVRCWLAAQRELPTEWIDIGHFKSERLVNPAKHNYTLEPNVTFSPDMKWVVFRSRLKLQNRDD
jgi:hypothetical protein